MESEIVPTRVGQESHPAIRRPQFRAEAQPHLGQPVGRRGEIRKALLLNAGITTPLTKRAPSPGRQKKAPTPFRHQGGHNCPHCGQLRVLKGRCSAHEIVALTLFSVEFGCLLRAAKSCWGVPGLLRHEGPFKKCVAENKIGFQPGSQVVTFLKISARSPGYYWEVVICFAADKEAARCTTT